MGRARAANERSAARIEPFHSSYFQGRGDLPGRLLRCISFGFVPVHRKCISGSSQEMHRHFSEPSAGEVHGAENGVGAPVFAQAGFAREPSFRLPVFRVMRRAPTCDNVFFSPVGRRRLESPARGSILGPDTTGALATGASVHPPGGVRVHLGQSAPVGTATGVHALPDDPGSRARCRRPVRRCPSCASGSLNHRA